MAKGTGAEEYLDTVDSALHLAINTCQPDAIVYDAGVDIHTDDDLGHLNITTQGVLQRDKLVFAACEGLGLLWCKGLKKRLGTMFLLCVIGINSASNGVFYTLNKDQF